jgi:hypothetical protein
MIEFDAQNSGNGISGVQISKIFRVGDRGFGVRHGQGFRLDPRLPVRASEVFWKTFILTLNHLNLL